MEDARLGCYFRSRETYSPCYSCLSSLWRLEKPHFTFGIGAIGLFTVAILGSFSTHFQTHFWLIFVYLAEEQISNISSKGLVIRADEKIPCCLSQTLQAIGDVAFDSGNVDTPVIIQKMNVVGWQSRS